MDGEVCETAVERPKVEERRECFRSDLVEVREGERAQVGTVGLYALDENVVAELVVFWDSNLASVSF